MDKRYKVQVKDLHKSYGNNEVLQGINLNVAPNEVVCMIGPSGSGKSTFLRCLNRLEVPNGGHVYIDGYDIADPKVNINKVRENIGMVFQHFNLFPNMSVLENITLAPTQLGKASKEEAKKDAMHYLELVGLESKADVNPQTLSGGQKQRLCIARALLKHPRILIFDDSTSAVDTATDARIRAGLASLKDTTKLIIAQRVSSIMHADQIIILDDGRIVAQGTHSELLASSPVYQELYASQQKGVSENG